MYLLAKETVLEVAGKKELGYSLISGIGYFDNQESCFKAIQHLNLPIGWVCIHIDQLIPGYMDMENFE